MDLLTDLLRQAGLRRRFLDMRGLSSGAALRFPCERSIGLHVLVRGRAFVHAPKLPTPLALEPGDVAVMARGSTHVVSPRATLLPSEPVVLVAPRDAEDHGGEAETALVSGAYQLWQDPAHPFFAQIPDWMVLRASAYGAESPLGLTMRLLQGEIDRRSLGSESVLNGLFDAILTYALRELVEGEGRACPGWSLAVSDLSIRALIDALHEDMARDWTLEAMAEVARLSRTALAERFRNAMGEPPAAHLRSIRVQKAMQLLSETALNLDEVALRVGYQDAFSFSKVFKRATGLTPGTFRRRDREDRANPMRIPAE
jgi:AraC-like DNA-binding protein